MAKTFIAVPCMDQVPSQFAHCLSVIQKVGDTTIGLQIGSLVYNSRNELARKAIANEADFVLWLDSDMVFAPDLLPKLMAHMADPDVSIVTGVYYRRLPPYTPVLYGQLDIEDRKCTWSEATGELPNEPFEVAGAGFGGLLMRAGVLLDVGAKFGELFNPIHGTGEDLSFCWRARQCGYKILCDPSVQLGHVGHTIIDKKFADAYRVLREQKEQETAQELLADEQK